MESCDKPKAAEEQNNGETPAETTVVSTASAEAPVSEEKEEQKLPNYVAMTKTELLDALDKLVEQSVDDVRDEVSAVKHAFYAIRKSELEKEKEEFLAKGNEESAFAPRPDDDEARLKELLNKYKEKKAEQLAALEAQLQEHLDAKKKILAELSEIVQDTDNINKHYQRFQQLQQEFKDSGDVPPSEDKNLWKEYQQLTEQFYDLWKINKELRDYDFKKNLEQKQALCEEAEKLDAEPDVVIAFRKLQELHNKWREIGPVVKELREDLWKRFKEASTVINKKHQGYFEARKEQEKVNEEAKTAICEEMEAIKLDELGTYAKWNDATKQVLALQEKWKTLGFAARKANNELFARFRKACDAFFAEKAAFFKKIKEESAENLAKRISLCEQAEALKDSTDWKKTAETLTALQKEWKTIGPVRKGGEAAWKRFIAACDYFFDNKNKNFSSLRQSEQANLKAKKAVVEKLKTLDEGLSKEDARKQLKELSAEFKEIGHVPFKDKDKIYDEYKAALDAAYAKFDVNELRSANFAEDVESMSGNKDRLYREREKLVRQYEQKRNELKTYENNLGFFNATSKSGNSMLKEVERRVSRVKDELSALEKKISLIDEKL